ncbi:WG repeat-containing protein [Evansella sp. AB-P1]|uniref:WG repeat-containing protein n=1 Tax=Evansella sp. AB-P1 TaxID=3037653 RepID=UPI00241EEA14|nr:WG repeat-containing protein [Evansella sp. AB-P1]MDG5790184.1 WG repeat-containing protein [Evansella sp. AB-P1]
MEVKIKGLDYDRIWEDTWVNGVERYLAIKGSNRGIIEKSGKVIIPVKYDTVEHDNGYYIVTENLKKGLFSSEGKMILPIQYDAIVTSNGNVATIKNNGKIGVFNLKTKNIVVPLIKEAAVFDANYIAMRENGLWVIYNENGDIWIPPIFTNVAKKKYDVTALRNNTRYASTGEFFVDYPRKNVKGGTLHIKERIIETIHTKIIL